MPRLQHLAAAVLLALLAACVDSARAPADAAIKGTESLLASARAEAEQYAPEQLKAVEEGLAGAKAMFGKGEFKAALAAARELPGKALALGSAAAARKAELVKAFEELSARVPAQLDAARQKLEALAGAKKLPAGFDAAGVQAAREKLAEAAKGWGEAAARMKEGALQEAAAAAKAAQQKAGEVAAYLEGPK